MSESDSQPNHTYALPQQRLLLEMLNMSGEIAVMGERDDSLLWSTLDECHAHQWITLHKLSDTATTIRLANSGRELLES